METIQIVSAPAIKAPIAMQEAWKGINLPLTEDSPAILGMVATEKPISYLEKTSYYKVESVEVIRALALRNPEAAQYWSDKLKAGPEVLFLFSKESCRLTTW